jgi:hypothetical protein
MAIVNTDPLEWDRVNTLQVDSDAQDNASAIAEINRWAAERGFARTNEYWLRRVRTNNGMIFRGICYRVTDDERATARERLGEAAERRRRIADIADPVDTAVETGA